MTELQTPTTPITDDGSPDPAEMDSEDEFMSDALSIEDNDFDGTQDSEIESLGGGQYSINFPLCLAY